MALLEKASDHVPAGLREMLLELGAGETGFGGTSFGRGEATLEQFLIACREGEDPAKVSPGFVPQTIFWMMDDGGQAVGMVRVRHYLNDKLLQSGGNVGYYVARAQRGKGYAKAALREAVQVLREMGINRVLVTVSPTNPASIGVVLANGGKFDGHGRSPVSGEVMNRYWVDT